MGGTFMRSNRVLITLLVVLFAASAVARAADPDGVEPMKKVHARFTGTSGTLALFGDSITVSMAYWAPLRGEPKGMSEKMAAAHRRVKGYLQAECWDKWRGAKFGNEGGMTIRWAHENVDKWLKDHNPEVAVIMFGTNDLGALEEKEYEEKTAEVVERCLKNGTVVILTTPPPRSGLVDKSKQFAEAVRRVAKNREVPLIDYHAEMLKRRPDDWDGALPKFKDVKGSEYEVPTLIARDGVHPSFPKAHQDYSKESLSCNGYALRSYLTLLAYDEVLQKVLKAKEQPRRRSQTEFENEEKGKPQPRGKVEADTTRPTHFPHRIWAACDFEGRTPDYAWFGPPETKNIPRYPGNYTALGVSEKPYGKISALMTGINPVPGPRMGKVNYLYLRYFLKGTDEATFQYFSLTREDNNHIHVTGLTQGTWSELTVNFTRDARRNDGSNEPFKEGERMDDLKVFVGKPGDGKSYELFLDDVIFFAEDPQLPAEKEPFPNRVIFLAAFDTGPKEKYWPGEFEIVEKDLPADSYWRVAKAVPHKNGKGKWIRLQIEPPRPVGEHTKLRFRYHLTGASALTVQIFDATDQDNRHIRLKDLKQGTWETVHVDFTRDGKRNDGKDTPFGARHKVDDLFFLIESDDDVRARLLIDEVVLYDAGKPGGS
jgi:lysophospholipase L1-like esterase